MNDGKNKQRGHNHNWSHSSFLKHSQIKLRRSISLLCTPGNTADKLDT